MTVRIIIGDCREVLRTLPAESVHCCVTSPPYWGLRDYGVPPSIWGGRDDCEHEWGATVIQGQFCQHCGAWFGAHGLEPNYELFIANEVRIFQEVWRVLRANGTLWLNLGDSYAAGAGKVGDHPGGGEQGERRRGGPPSDKSLSPVSGFRGVQTVDNSGKHAYRMPRERPQLGATSQMADRKIAGIGPLIQPNRMPQSGLKPKDMVGIPWRVSRRFRQTWLSPPSKPDARAAELCLIHLEAPARLALLPTGSGAMLFSLN